MIGSSTPIRILLRHDDGEHLATDTFFPRVYQELKRIARQRLRESRGVVTLSTTELVHETFFRLAGPQLGRKQSEWQGRAHFFGAASRAMRRVLVDFARRRRADKRGGDWSRISLGHARNAAVLEIELDQIIAVNAALDRLDALSPRLREVVELRFFAGLPAPEVAMMLGVSARTVERDWLKARMFLLRELALFREPSSAPGAGG